MQQRPYYPFNAQTEAQPMAEQQNKVLRNTYLLLAISMLPTVLGAYFGLQIAWSLGLGFLATNPVVSMIAFLGISWLFIWGIGMARNSLFGVALLLAFTFFMGAMLSPLLFFTLSLHNGGQLIATAAGGTGAIFFTLAGIATFTKKDFSFMGKFLTIGLFVVLLAIAANLFFHLPALQLAISAVCVGLFSLFILYDISKIVHGGETNYITATLSIYLDVYNLFVHLLRLLAALSGRD